MLEIVADWTTIIGVILALLGMFLYLWHQPTPRLYLVWQPTYGSGGGTLLRLENRGPGIARKITVFYDMPEGAYAKYEVMIYGFGGENDDLTDIEDRTLEIPSLLPYQYAKFGFISNANDDNLIRWGYRSPFPVEVTYRYGLFNRRIRHPMVQHPSIPSPQQWEEAHARMSSVHGVAPDIIFCFGPETEIGWVDVGFPGEIYR